MMMAVIKLIGMNEIINNEFYFFRGVQIHEI